MPEWAGRCERAKETPERIRGGESICGVIYKGRDCEAGSLEIFDGFFSPTLDGGGWRHVAMGFESRAGLRGAYNVAGHAVTV